MRKLTFLIVSFMFLGQLEAQTTTAPLVYQVAPSTGISQAAAQQTQALNASAKVNTLLGVMLLSQCMSGKSPNMMMCMLGAYALAQGMNAQNAANQAAQTASVTTVPQFVPVATAVAPVTTVTGTAAAPLVATLPQSALAGLKTVSTAGYTVTSEGVTNASGQAVPMPSLTSKQQLTSFGLDEKTVSQVQRTIASAQQP